MFKRICNLNGFVIETKSDQFKVTNENIKSDLMIDI